MDDTDKMLDIVYGNVYFDMNDIFYFGNTKETISNALKNNAESFMSDYSAKKSSAEDTLGKYVSMLNELE